MKYWYQKPHPSLAEYVRTVLILEGFSQPEADQLPLFTNGMSAFLYRSERDAEGNEVNVKLTLSGKEILEDYWVMGDTTTVIVYFFKSFALPCVFNVSAATLAETPIDLCNWNAHKTNALRMQLAYAISTSQKLEVLDHLLIHQLQQNKKECEIVKYATDELMCNSSAEALSELLTKLDLSERTFQRIFKKYVGVSPNQYRRICQFQLSFAQLKAGKFDKLADVAYDSGFADQSHFIRAFREFTEITPKSYLQSGLKEKKP